MLVHLMNIVRLGIVFILDFADKLLQDVFHRDQAGCTAKFINNNRNMDLTVLELT